MQIMGNNQKTDRLRVDNIEIYRLMKGSHMLIYIMDSII